MDADMKASLVEALVADLDVLMEDRIAFRFGAVAHAARPIIRAGVMHKRFGRSYERAMSARPTSATGSTSPLGRPR
jgi:hypothetical protein